MTNTEIDELIIGLAQENQLRPYKFINLLMKSVEEKHRNRALDRFSLMMENGTLKIDMWMQVMVG